MSTTLIAVVSTRTTAIGLSSVLAIALFVVNPWSMGQNTPERRAPHKERLSTPELPAKIFSLTLPASVDSGQIPDVHHLVEFDVIGSAGLRWIAGLGQDDSCHPDLAYFMRGMSDDGKVFIMIRATLANSAARHIWPDERCDADSSPRGVYDVII